MRGVWLAVLLLGTGCQAISETASGFRGGTRVSAAKPLSSTAHLAAAAQAAAAQAAAAQAAVAQAAVEPAAVEPAAVEPATFSAESERNVDEDGDAPLLSDRSRPILQAASQPVGAAAPLFLTLDAAIETALERNPNLVVVRSGGSVAHAAYRASEVYPWNPFVQVAVLPYAREKTGNILGVNHYVWLMQTIELAHQQRYREASARAALNQVRWNIVAAELANVAQTERLYFTVLYQRGLRDLARRAATFNRELSEIVDRRFQAGLATALARTTARVTVRQSRRQGELAEANYQTSLLSLQRQLNLSSPEFLPLTGSLEEFTWLPVSGDGWSSADHSQAVTLPDDFVADLAFHRPDVLAAQSVVGMVRAKENLARANQVQNISIGPFYERDETGTVFAGFRTQMSLSVWNTGHALTAQRRAEANLQIVTFQQLRSRAEIEAKTAIERYERARRILANERASFPEMSLEELQDIKEQFASGQASILDVFSVQNTLLQERRTALDLLNEVAQASADVSLLAGLPPARLVTAGIKVPRGLEKFSQP